MDERTDAPTHRQRAEQVVGIRHPDVHAGQEEHRHQDLAESAHRATHVGSRGGDDGHHDGQADLRKARGDAGVGERPQAGVEPAVSDHVGPEDARYPPRQQSSQEQVASQPPPASDQRRCHDQGEGPQRAEILQGPKLWGQAARQRTEQPKDVELCRSDEARRPGYEERQERHRSRQPDQIARPAPVGLLGRSPEQRPPARHSGRNHAARPDGLVHSRQGTNAQPPSAPSRLPDASGDRWGGPGRGGAPGRIGADRVRFLIVGRSNRSGQIIHGFRPRNHAENALTGRR